MDEGGQALVKQAQEHAVGWPQYQSHEGMRAMRIKALSDLSTAYPVMHLENGYDLRATSDGMFDHYEPVPGDYVLFWPDGSFSLMARAHFDQGFTPKG